MKIEVERVASLRFADGSPVRAASAVARLGDGWLIAQDDATHAAWLRDGKVTAIRVLPAVAGLDVFEEAAGTKHLKPDLEAACEVNFLGSSAVLLLGSGSTPARMRAALVGLHEAEARVAVADLSSLYASIARVLAVGPEDLNMEGGCVVGRSFRWFHRGRPAAGLPTCSVDLDLAGLLAAVGAGGDAATVKVANPHAYDLGKVRGVGLAVTDAVSLGGRSVLVSAAAEDTANPRDDGPVRGSALAVVEDAEVKDLAALPDVNGRPTKVEGLALLDRTSRELRLLATVDADDPRAASLTVELRVLR